MKVVHFTDPIEALVLVEDRAPDPRPGRGELLIRIYAAGVTPTEAFWYPTSHTKTGEPRTGAVPGHEFSGVVAGIGEGVDQFGFGDEVFGMNDWFSDGAMAEYCVAPSRAIAPKPAGLTHVEAASVPIGSLTAWQGLFDRAKLQSGERVLVQGGAGAVGLFVVQLARMHGAHVIATASAHNAQLVSSLGAQQVIDYKASRFEESVKDVDVVFDTVGGETLDRSWSVLRSSGRMITITAEGNKATDRRTRDAFFIVEPNQKELGEIGSLLDKGRLQTIVDEVIPLSLAPDAYAAKVARQGRGKMVVAIASTD